MILPFSVNPLPEIHFGPGRISDLPALAARHGRKILMILGGRSFHQSCHWPTLQKDFNKQGCLLQIEQVTTEPSPELIDAIVARHQTDGIDTVVAIGGGSVLDAGKAVAAMLVEGGPVECFLEGVGDQKPSGRRLPFIAVPTTAGTGSEATSNAVLTSVGGAGFKRSLRHQRFVPDIALVDPALSLSMPRNITVACGMDAFSQLVEAYLSTQASPFTDALAFDGIRAVRHSLLTVCNDGTNLAARADMAYAALLSGIVLSQAGLGVIHGFASAIGGLFPIPHGVVCGTLMAACNRITLERLRRSGDNPGALDKYCRLGSLFMGDEMATAEYCQDLFIAELDKLTDELAIAPLGQYGIDGTHLEQIIEQTGNKCNPVTLDREEMRRILFTRL